MSLTNTSDQQLIIQCQQGDRDAFVELYNRYKTNVLNYAWTIVRDQDLAADVCQETFQYIFKKLADYQEQGKFRGLLYKAARNLSFSAKKKAQRQQHLNIDQDHIASSSTLPADKLEQAEQHAQLDQALQKLPESQRDVLILRFHESLSYENIAIALEIPIGTVRSRLHNGLEKMKEHMTGKK